MFALGFYIVSGVALLITTLIVVRQAWYYKVMSKKILPVLSIVLPLIGCMYIWAGFLLLG